VGLKIERLSPEHDRGGFDRENEPLNRKLKETARQHGERGIARTFVLLEDCAGAGESSLLDLREP
jgi:hypothetical protein